jgi:DNA-binding response OmpR family regulator
MGQGGSPLSNAKILFADDSATMRTVVEKTFLAEPFDVTTVPSGEAAILKTREINPSIVIVDAGMAGVSGYDVCKAIREDSSTAGVPVIIMAGVSNPYDKSRGKEVGASNYVKKPFDTTQLIESVGNLIEAAKKLTPVPESPLPFSREVPTMPPLPVASVLDEAIPVKPRPIATSVKVPLKEMKEQLPVVSQTRQEDAVNSFEAKSINVGLPRNEPMEAVLEDAEPIEIQEINEEAAEAFQVSTLAEMAQMSSDGEPMSPETDSGAISLSSESERLMETELEEVEAELEEVEVPSAKVSVQLPIAEAVQEQVRAASLEISGGIDSVTPAQVDAIQQLSADVIERIVWEVVPELAETMIKEALSKLLEE